MKPSRNTPIIEGLKVHPTFFHSVTNLYLAQNRLSDTAAHYLDNAIRAGKLPYLRTLDVSGNNLTTVGKNCLSKTVDSIDHQILITLDKGVVVTKTQLSFADSYRNNIYKAYKPHEIIDFSGSLGIRANKQSDVGKLLEKIISFRSFEDIKCLLFVETTMGKNTSKHIASLLSNKNFNFDGVYLSKNQIGDMGIPHIINAFSAHPKFFHSVTKLDVSNNSLTDAGAQVISNALASGSLPNLKITHLEGNKISTNGIGHFVKALDSPNVLDISIIFKVANTVESVIEFIDKGLKYAIVQHAQSLWEVDRIRTNIEGKKWKDCKDTAHNVGMGYLAGLIKCTPLEIPQAIAVCAAKDSIAELFRPETLGCYVDIKDSLGETVDNIIDYFGQ